MPKKPQLQAVYLEWTDPKSAIGWMSAEEAAEVADVGKCRSIGFIVRETKKYISISHTILLGNDEFADCITLPVGCILRRVNITQKVPKNKLEIKD